MSLNIKNEEVHDLVRRAAQLTGKSQTSVVEDALRRYLDQIDAETKAREEEQWAKVLDAVGELQRLVREQGGLGMSPEDLYDPETGLPA